MANDFPATIGKYKILGVVAKGGMGVIYKAQHPSLKRFVVIKKLTARKGANAERFKREAQILLDLQSPYIVHLFDYFTEGGYRYMVEELVDGMALDMLLKKQGAFPPQIAMLILQDACYALKYAHSKEIVHRDIKPGNILISKRGEIKLADFGIASDDRDENSDTKDVTQSGVALGTPAYMPPEQFEDSSQVDKRADIYALGIMLYEMLTGSKPYPGTFTVETLNTIKKGKYINPRKIDKTIPKELVKLVHKMIRPKPKARFQSVDPIIKIIKKYLKKFDTHEIRVQIAKSIVATKDYEYEAFEEKGKKRKLFKRILLAAIGVAAIFAGLFYTGVIHRTILSKVYSPVNVEIKMPVPLSGNLDMPIKATFFENDGNEIPEVPGTRREFKVKGSRFYEKLFVPEVEVTSASAGRRSTIYDTKTVFLKDGDYRVKVVVGSYVRWKSFSVEKGEVKLSFDFLQNMRKELNITAVCIDKATGLNISDKVTFEVLDPLTEKWENLYDFPSERMLSGTVWKFRVSGKGYTQETFSLLIDWYQDDLFLSATLEKK